MIKMFCTPDGGKFFNNEEEMLRYVSEKCGKDIADFFSEGEELYEILGSNSPWDFSEAIENYDIDKSSGDLSNPVYELKRLRELKKMFEDLLLVYIKLYEKI